MLEIKNAESITLNVLGKKKTRASAVREHWSCKGLARNWRLWWSHVSFVAKELRLLSVDRIMNGVQPS